VWIFFLTLLYNFDQTLNNLLNYVVGARLRPLAPSICSTAQRRKGVAEVKGECKGKLVEEGGDEAKITPSRKIR
jgi:hypothetical protein